MNDKIALVSCSGLSPLGLVVRAATVELALDNENIVDRRSQFSAQHSEKRTSGARTYCSDHV